MENQCLRLIFRIVLFTFVTLNSISCKKKTEKNIINESSLVIGQVDSIYSNVLGESREIWIYIPESAKEKSNEAAKYPVLYLLDGPSHFKSLAGMVDQLSLASGNMVVPEMIVVGIANTNRTLDLTPSQVDIDFISGDSIPYISGGGNNFLDFVEEELIPHMEKAYPASGYRTFVGHSFGGLSVINALVTRPELFSNYVAIDPSLWWDNRGFLNFADSLLTKNRFENKSLFIGVANTLEEGMDIESVQSDTVPDTYYTIQMKSIMKFVKSLESKEYNNLLFKWEYYPDDDHGSVPLITEYDALRFLFPWYRLDGVNDLYSQNSTMSTDDILKMINSHYENISNKFGYKIIPSEQFINNMGYGFMNNDMNEKSFALFNLNIQNYPRSSNVYDSMGDCFLAKQDSTQALKYFTKALQVGKNDFSQEKIDMLKK